MTQPRSALRRLGDLFDPRTLGRTLLFWLAWLAAGWGAWNLHQGWAGPRVAPGAAEIVEYKVTAAEPQTILALHAEPGDMVEQGQLLVELDPLPLAKELSVVAAELAAAEADLHAEALTLGRERLTEERDFDRLVDEAELGLLSARIEADRDRADLQGVKQRLQWWKAQVSGQYASAERLEELKAEAEALTQRIALRESAMGAWRGKIDEMRKRRSDFQSYSPPRPPAQPERELAPQRAAIEVAAARHSQLLARMALLTLRAPASGVVTQVLARPGEWLASGLPSVVLRDPHPRRVQAFVDPDQVRGIDPGDRAVVSPRDGSGRKLRGVVQTVAMGVTEQPGQMPLGLYGKPRWSQSVWIALLDDGLRPGEQVDVLLLDEPAGDAPELRIKAADTPPARAVPAGPSAAALPDPAPLATPVTATAPQPLMVPDVLRAASQFEPSGWLWLPGSKRFLTVSDDTGLAADDAHPAWLFAVDPVGQVAAEVLRVADLPEQSDIEAIAGTEAGPLWLLSSQSVSKKGKRSLARTLLVQLDNAQSLRKVGAVSLTQLLAQLSATELAALGLTAVDPGFKKGVAGFDRLLDVEALAQDGDDLLLGLKAPVGHSGALIWRLRNPTALMTAPQPRLAQGQLEALPALAVSPPLGHTGRVGLSDLHAVGPGRWLALTVAEVPDNAPKIGSSLWLIALQEGKWRLQRVADFAGLHAEGVSLGPTPGVAWVVFDQGAAAPLWTKVALPAERSLP